MFFVFHHPFCFQPFTTPSGDPAICGLPWSADVFVFSVHVSMFRVCVEMGKAEAERARCVVLLLLLLLLRKLALF